MNLSLEDISNEFLQKIQDEFYRSSLVVFNEDLDDNEERLELSKTSIEEINQRIMKRIEQNKEGITELSKVNTLVELKKSLLFYNNALNLPYKGLITVIILKTTDEQAARDILTMFVEAIEKANEQLQILLDFQ